MINIFLNRKFKIVTSLSSEQITGKLKEIVQKEIPVNSKGFQGIVSEYNFEIAEYKHQYDDSYLMSVRLNGEITETISGSNTDIKVRLQKAVVVITTIMLIHLFSLMMIFIYFYFSGESDVLPFVYFTASLFAFLALIMHLLIHVQSRIVMKKIKKILDLSDDEVIAV
ncbi:MAG: hypothetical protein AB1Z23_11970 [Eubacteriales bacterium]